MKISAKEKYMKSVNNLKLLDDKILKQKQSMAKMKDKIIRITIDEVCSAYNVTLEDLIKKDRHSPFVLPRQVLMYKLRNIGLGLKAIGKIMQRDHTTVMYGIQKIDEQKDLYEDIKID